MCVLVAVINLLLQLSVPSSSSLSWLLVIPQIMFLLTSVSWNSTHFGSTLFVSLKALAHPSLPHCFYHIFPLWYKNLLFRPPQKHSSAIFISFLTPPTLITLSPFPPGQLMFSYYWSVFWFPPIISFTYSPYYIKKYKRRHLLSLMKRSDGQRWRVNSRCWFIPSVLLVLKIKQR